MAAVLVLGATTGTLLLMTSSVLGSSFVHSLLAALMIAIIAMLALPVPFMSRTMSFEVDARGVRTRGMSRSSFNLRWEEIARIEFVPMEKMPVIPFFNSDSAPRVPPHRMYAFLDRDGKVLAGLPPHGILHRELGNRLEAALLTQASEHAIPVVEVQMARHHALEEGEVAVEPDDGSGQGRLRASETRWGAVR